jgi:hypothetical protein
VLFAFGGGSFKSRDFKRRWVSCGSQLDYGSLGRLRSSAAEDLVDLSKNGTFKGFLDLVLVRQSLVLIGVLMVLTKALTQILLCQAVKVCVWQSPKVLFPMRSGDQGASCSDVHMATSTPWSRARNYGVQAP